MTTDIGDMIADFLRQANPDSQSRQEYQAEALREVECIDPRLGRWIPNEVEYLFSAFALNEKDFAEFLPTMAHVTSSERRLFVEKFEEHFERCTHCSLKRGYELELTARIEQTCRQNKDVLLQLLEESEPDKPAEGEHCDVKALSAHQ